MYRKYPELTHDLNVVLASVVVGGVLLVISVLYKQRIYRNAVLSGDDWFFADQTIEADSDGLNIATVKSRATYKWSSFVHSAEDERNSHLFIDNAQALIVPKAAMSSTDQLAQFRSWSRIDNPK